jgi:AraC-like DNA-binding protein
MRPFFEVISPEPGTSWTFLDRRLPNGIPFEWHHHPEFELTLTLNSRGHRYIGDDVSAYEDGDLVLVGPGIPHSWFSRELVDASQPHVALVIWFTYEWVSGLTSNFPEMSQIKGVVARASQGLAFGCDAASDVAPTINAMRTASSTRRLLLLFEVLSRLCQDRAAVPLANSPRTPLPQIAADHRIFRVLDHLHKHYAQPILVETLADIACVSASAFHRMFLRHTRTTAVDYLMRLRIGRACSLLIGTAQPIATIAADVGYTNMSLFNRQFMRLKGEPPSGFRRQHRLMPGDVAHEVSLA